MFQNVVMFQPKVLVASKFERNLDRRTWGEKLTCYASKVISVVCVYEGCLKKELGKFCVFPLSG